MSTSIEYAVEARYASQVWELEVPLRTDNFSSAADLDALVDDFHAAHEQIFAVKDPDSSVEFVGWSAAVRCQLREGPTGQLKGDADTAGRASKRDVFFENVGMVETPVFDLAQIDVGKTIQGPALIESPFTTIVVDPTATFALTENRAILIKP